MNQISLFDKTIPIELYNILQEEYECYITYNVLEWKIKNALKHTIRKNFNNKSFNERMRLTEEYYNKFMEGK